MPFTNATQDQMEVLERRLRLLHQAVQRTAQGEYPAPLIPERRIKYAALAFDLATILQELEVLGEHGMLPGPNDILVDKSLPVRVTDSATGGSIAGAFIPASNGNPVSVDVSGDDTGAILMDGQQLPVRGDRKTTNAATGALVFVGPQPSYLQLPSGYGVVRDTETFRITVRGGAESHDGSMYMNAGGNLAAILPDGVAFAKAGGSFPVYDYNEVFTGKYLGIRLNVNGTLKGGTLLANCVVVKHDEVLNLNVDGVGKNVKFAVSNGKITSITSV